MRRHVHAGLMALLCVAAASLPVVAGETFDGPAQDAMPDCATIAKAFAPLLAGMALEEEEHLGPEDAGGYGHTCTWAPVPPESDDPLDRLVGGGLMVTIMVGPFAREEAALREAGWHVDEPRMQALGGFLVIPSGQYDAAAPVPLLGIRAAIGDVSIGAMAMPYYDGRPNDGLPASGDVVAGLVALHAMLRR